MIVSIINGQPLYGVEYKNANEVFTISMQDFQKIQSGQGVLVGQEVIDIPVVIVEKTEEELATERKQALLSRLATIQEESLSKRLEYTIARDIVPEGNIIREMKLSKLSYELDQLFYEYEKLVSDLIINYGQGALSYIV